MASGLSSSEEPPSTTYTTVAAPSLEERPSEARAPARIEKWLGLEGESEDHEKVSDSKTTPVQRPGHECGMPRHHYESPPYNFSHGKYPRRGSPPSPPHQHYSHSPPLQSRSPGRTPSPRLKQRKPIKNTHPELKGRRTQEPKSPPTTLPPLKPQSKPTKQEKVASAPHSSPSKPYSRSKIPLYDFSGWKYMYPHRGSPPSPPHQHYSHSPPQQSRFPSRRHLQHQSTKLSSPRLSPVHRIELSRSSESSRSSPHYGGEDRERFEPKQHAKRQGYSRTPSTRSTHCDPLEYDNSELNHHRIKGPCPKSPPTTPPPPKPEPKPPKQEKTLSAPHPPPSKPYSRSKNPLYDFSGWKYPQRGSPPSTPHQHHSHSPPPRARSPGHRHLRHRSPSPSPPHVHRTQRSQLSESGRSSPRYGGEDRERFEHKRHAKRQGYNRTPSSHSKHREPLKYDNSEPNQHRIKEPCPKLPPTTPPPPKPESKPPKPEKVPSTRHQPPSKPYPPREFPSYEIPHGKNPHRGSPPSPPHQHYSHSPPPGRRHLRHRSPSPSPHHVHRTQRSRSSESGRSSPLRYGGEDRERFESKSVQQSRQGYSRTPSPHSKHHEPLEYDNPASKQHRIEEACPKSPPATPPPPKPQKALSASHQPPSLEELLSDVPKEKLNKQCRSEELAILSRSITDWQAIAPFMGLTEAEEQAIKVDSASEERRRIAMLRKWKGKVGKKATYKTLAEAFYKFENTDLVEKLCELLQESRDNSSKSGEDSATVTPQVHVHSPVASCEQKQKRPLLASYANYLQGVYRTENPGFLILQWPPPPTRKVFNLAMILQQSIRCGRIDEELVRLTLRGNVDDIMHRKTAVKVENIFKLDRADRTLILIEGAPGAGKSTLAWHVPQKWARGELFQEFEVVVFIQLRDPEVQAAQSLADLLPAQSRAEAENIASKLCASRGQNTLIVLDSWDEFSPQLKQGSIFQQLICKPKILNLHFSTVLITSRPIASGVLYPYISSRVEIVGFTPTERKHYFTEVLGGDSEKVQKLQEHLSTRPMIEASCYLPLNAAIVAHLFLALNQTLPTTLQEVFTSMVICCLIRHMQRERREEELDIPDTPSFEDLPVDIQQPFMNICILAYHGIMKNKVTFSASDLQSFNLPTELSTLSLIQGLESFKSFKKAKSYNFLHLSIQELLAAFYIAKVSENEQIRIFKELFGEPRFATVFQYYAAFSKLQAEGVRDVIVSIVRSDGNYLLLSLLHCLYEAQDLSLCHFVACQLNGELDLYGNSLSPVGCLAVGYFLRSVCLTTSGEFKANLRLCSLDDYRVGFLVRELSKCSRFNDPQSMAATDGGAPGCLDLDLNSNKEIEGHGAKCIAELLSRCSLIGKLTLNFCEKLQGGEDGLYHLLQALKVNTSLRDLSLWCCALNITEDNGPVLTEMLQTNKTLKSLMLYSNNVSDMGVFHLAEGLSHNTGLEKLFVFYCTVTGKGAAFLSKALIVNKSLTTLDISKNDLGDDGIAHISHSLTINTTLRELDLGECKLTEKGAELLAQMLKTNKSLTTLSISENDLGDDGIAHISHSLTINTTLRELDLGECKLTEKGAELLAQMLKTNKSLTTLDIDKNDLGDDGIAHISHSLTINTTLRELHLGECKLTEKGAELLAQMLKTNKSLTTLEISVNDLGDDGIAHISHSLTTNTTLRELHLGECKLTEKGAELLAQMLTVNKGLEALHLWENAISDTSATHIGNALKHNHSLKKLSVFVCGIGDPAVTSLATVFTVNSTLEKLNLSFNQFTDTGLVALGDCLKNNRGLQRLGLWNLNPVTAEGLRQFVLCLQENCHLTKLDVNGTAGGTVTVRHETEMVNKARRQRGLPELVVTDKLDPF